MKRMFDLTFGLMLFALFLPVFLTIVIFQWLRRDLPIFYVSERMKTLERSFMLIKFRTMRPPRASEVNTGVSGGDKSDRITPIGRLLRGKRLDEIPQLINIIRGDMSFVGPRPPLRQYTDAYPQLYGQILRNKPGLTGLASIVFHRHEALLLSQAHTPLETEDIYVRRCIPRKARLDLIYQKKQSLRLDIYILYLTAAKIIPLPGRRACRLR